jgi:cytoskeletal protein RodZ
VSDDGKTERALDLLVYAPVGVALYLRDTLPTFVNLFVSRGRAELGQRRQQAQNQVAQAKAMGEFAVNFGGPKVREHVEKGIALARKGAESVLGGAEDEGGVPDAADEATSPAPAPRPDRAAANSKAASRPAGESTATATATTAAPAPAATTLVIPDYDELSASQVVERLDGLPASELDAVRAYEEAHRARRTILYKIEQLTS